MGELTIKVLREKMHDCLIALDSDECSDRLYVIFIVCEYCKYYAACIQEFHCPNNEALRKAFKFGDTAAKYRNSFAHSDNLNTLLSLLDRLKESKVDICKEFSGDIYLKVYNALC